ncbi:MAG: L,D-transpeptidase family protein [Thermoleophilia bacterium]
MQSIRSRTWILGGVAAAVLVVAGIAAYVATHAGASLRADDAALAAVDVDAFGGHVERVTARAADGREIAMREEGGRLTPVDRVRPGERIELDVTVRRPGWDGWALGHAHHVRLSLRAPAATVPSRYLTVADGAAPVVRFSRPVSVVAVDGRTRELGAARRQITIPRAQAAGAVRVAAAVRPWEDMGEAVTVAWFPRSSSPVAVVSPTPGGQIAPGAPVRLRFSVPAARALGGARPGTAGAEGSWARLDAHTLQFTPSARSVNFGARLHITLPRAIDVIGADGGTPAPARELTFDTPPGSTLRLQQLLAGAGYLPLAWKPAGRPVARNRRAQLQAAFHAPKGTFRWRFADTPRELRALWAAGRPNTILRGAIMRFQDTHGLTVDALAGPAVWNALIADAIHRTRLDDGYSYVYVHRDLPQRLVLWHDGRTVLTSPGNTGVPAAPTELGTFPVFEHLPVTTMAGTNPDGSHYDDPGVKWVSYFNGGDALHAFDRASFGTPQSLGCVELPEATAARVYPYTPIGTLVTIEN